MSKKILALVLSIIMLFVTGCNPNDNGDDNKENGKPITPESENNSPLAPENGGVEERNADGDYFYRGRITSLDSDRHIEMEAMDSQVAFGIYCVLVSKETKFKDKSGQEISRQDLKVGDVIEVTFSGQVMMSLPPQISAWTITLQ